MALRIFRVIVLGLFASATGHAAVEGVELYYTFDGEAGISVRDHSGHNRDGTLIGADRTSNGLIGSGVSFNGNGGVAAGPIFDLTPTCPVLTACAWVKIPEGLSDSQLTVVCKQQGGTPWTGWALSTYLQSPIADIIPNYFSQCYEKPDVGIHDGQWHFLVAIFSTTADHRRTQLFVDGQLCAVGERPLHGLTRNGACLLIGMREDGAFPFKGIMDEIRIFLRGLSSEEIGQLYAAGADAAGMERAKSMDRPSARRSPAKQAPDVRISDEERADRFFLPVLKDDQLIGMEKAYIAPLTSDAVRLVAESKNGLTKAAPPGPAGAMLQFAFDGESDGRVEDTSGQGNHGRRRGGGYTIDGVWGRSLWFDGNTSVRVGDILDVGGEQPVLSIGLWFRIPMAANLPQMNMVGKQNADMPWQGWYVASYLGSPIADVIPERFAQCYERRPLNIHDGRWHHFGAVIESTEEGRATRVYLDGVSIASAQREGGGVTASDADFVVGMRADGTFPFTGEIDELRVYNRRLTDAEIVELARPGPAPESNANCGSVRGDLRPSSILNGGWMLVNGPVTNALWRRDGEVLHGLPPGSYTIRFRPYGDKAAPPEQVIAVGAGSTSIVTGVYAPDPDRAPPCIVRLVPPDNYVTKSGTLAVEVWALDNVGVDHVTFNGVEMTTEDHQIFCAKRSGLRGPFNTFEIVAHDTAMNAATQRVNYVQADGVTVAPMWNGNWQVRNPETNDVAFTWRADRGSEQGGGTVAHNATAVFQTRPECRFVELIVNGRVVDSAYVSPSKRR